MLETEHGAAPNPGPQPTGRDSRDAILTYRYLRIAMVAVLVMLGASVLWQGFSADCWLTSVSAYYYTPVRSVFVGSLVAFGAALIAYHGPTPEEEALLNLSGVMSIVVAFVPTGLAQCVVESVAPGATPETSALEAAATTGGVDTGQVIDDVRAAVTNSIWSLVIAGAVASFIAYWFGRSDPDPMGKSAVVQAQLPSWWTGIGRPVLVWACWLIPAVVFAAFLFFRDWFVSHAHSVAAPILVGGLVLYMIFNAALPHSTESFGRLRFHYRWIYRSLAVVLAVLVVLVLAMDLGPAIFALEFAILGVFIVYWSIQSIELRGRTVVAPVASGTPAIASPMRSGDAGESGISSE